MKSAHGVTVAVTGANGFIASEIIRQLLERGYRVVGSVRGSDTKDDRYAHLFTFHNSRYLTLVGGCDLSTTSSAWDTLVADAQVVIHTASPLSPPNNTEDAYCKPAIQGTLSVLDAVQRAKHVRQVVLTSSVAAVSSNAGALPATHVYTENDWSPLDRLKELQRWYPLSKTLAEKAAWDHPVISSGKVKLTTICPGYVIGPVTAAPHAEGTPKKWLSYESGAWTTIPNRGTVPVDVRDVARAHIRSFEDPTAQGRYAAVWSQIPHSEVVQAYLHFDPSKPNPPLDTSGPYQPLDLWDTSKCERLIGGWHSLDETVSAMSASFKKVGLLK